MPLSKAPDIAEQLRNKLLNKLRHRRCSNVMILDICLPEDPLDPLFPLAF